MQEFEVNHMYQINRRFHPTVVPGPTVPNVTRDVSTRDVSIRLINAQEEERSRVARELHDDLSQKLALLSLELEQLRNMVTGAYRLQRQFTGVQELVLEISTDIHRLSHTMHPSKLDHLGLSAAIKGLCRDFDAAVKIKIQFHEEGDLSKLGKEVKLCLFRVTQEALRNVARHSTAGWARVSIKRTEKEIRLSIFDDGRGFDMSSDALNSGLGFTSMRERVRILGGSIDINSSPGDGTGIDVKIPQISLVEKLEHA